MGRSGGHSGDPREIIHVCRDIDVYCMHRYLSLEGHIRCVTRRLDVLYVAATEVAVMMHSTLHPLTDVHPIPPPLSLNLILTPHPRPLILPSSLCSGPTPKVRRVGLSRKSAIRRHHRTLQLMRAGRREDETRRTPPCNIWSTAFITETPSREPSIDAEASRIPHAVRTGWIEAGTMRPKPAQASASRGRRWTEAKHDRWGVE